MLIEVPAPMAPAEGRRAVEVGRVRKRKPWEFTWDDECEIAGKAGARLPAASPIIGDATEVIERRLDSVRSCVGPRRSAPERRPRKRKAWEFSWDDRGDAGVTGPVPAIEEQGRFPGDGDAPASSQEHHASSSRSPASASSSHGAGLAEAPNIAEAAAGESSPPSRNLGRRRSSVRKRAAEGSGADSSPFGAASGLPSGMSSGAPGEPPPDPAEVERVRHQLLALGHEAPDGKPASPRDEVSWIRPRRSRHEVQVVHVRSAAKRSPQEPVGGRPVEGALRTDPLIANALRVVSLLRRNHEDENVIALRRAVRELREQIAGLEAQAYAKPSRPDIPLFRQVYDPKTRTG